MRCLAHSRILPLCTALLLGLLLLFTGCTTDAKLEVPANAAMLYQGKAVPWSTLLQYAEFRRELLDLRSRIIQWHLLRKDYAANPVPIDPQYMQLQYDRLYRNFGSEEAFRQQFGIGTTIPEDRFRQEVEQGMWLEALMLKDSPITDATLRDQYNGMDQNQLYEMFGRQLGLEEQTPISFEQIRYELRSMVAQQTLMSRMPTYLQDLMDKAIEDGRLQINYLPGETAPSEETTESDRKALPSTLAEAAAGLKTDREGATPVKQRKVNSDTEDPVAYTLDGEVVTWNELLSDPIVLLSVRRHLATLGAIFAVNYAFKEEGLTLDQSLFNTERDRMIDAIGGEEALPSVLAAQGISYDMYIDQIEREVKIRQLLLAAYPVQEEDLQNRYNQTPRKDWYNAYQGVLGLASESEATYARIRPQLEQDALNNLLGEKRPEYTTTLVQVLEDEHVMLVPDDPMQPQTGAPPEPHQPLIHGLDRLPTAPESVADALHLPGARLKIPSSAGDAPDAGHAASAGGHGADDGHGH